MPVVPPSIEPLSITPWSIALDRDLMVEIGGGPSGQHASVDPGQGSEPLQGYNLNLAETDRNPIETSRSSHRAPKSGSMQKLALKLLLTGLLSTRASKRLDGIQLATTLMTIALMVFVGLYAWTHSFY